MPLNVLLGNCHGHKMLLYLFLIFSQFTDCFDLICSKDRCHNRMLFFYLNSNAHLTYFKIESHVTTAAISG